MLCVSIRQPWAWAITNGIKDIENRSYMPMFNGRSVPSGTRLFIHAGKLPDDMCYRPEHDLFDMQYITVSGKPIIHLLPPTFPSAPSRTGSLFDSGETRYHASMGGIVGIATLAGVTRSHASPWFLGPYGWVLQDPLPLPLYPMPGQRRIFAVDSSQVVAYYRRLICDDQWTWPLHEPESGSKRDPGN
jgi:hypothetical protein